MTEVTRVPLQPIGELMLRRRFRLIEEGFAAAFCPATGQLSLAQFKQQYEAFFERDKNKLNGVFTRISVAMRALYLVSYRPTNLTRGWHEIDVKVSRPGIHLRHKPGYDRTTTQ